MDEAADMEHMVNPSESEEETALRIFRENLVPAAQAVCHLAAYAGNEGTRLRAAQYVVERNLGPIIASKADKDEAWEELVKAITRGPEAVEPDHGANGSGASE